MGSIVGKEIRIHGVHSAHGGLIARLRVQFGVPEAPATATTPTLVLSTLSPLAQPESEPRACPALDSALTDAPPTPDRQTPADARLLPGELVHSQPADAWPSTEAAELVHRALEHRKICGYSCDSELRKQ